MKGARVQKDDNYSEVDLRTAERIADAPLPTASTLRMRQNPVVQLWRFARINLKMMRIITRAHE